MAGGVRIGRVVRHGRGCAAHCGGVALTLTLSQGERGKMDCPHPGPLPGGAVHNHRHSRESRRFSGRNVHPEGPGNGVQSETPSLNPP